MSAHCQHHAPAASAAPDGRYRRVLWIALVLNLAMFGVELGAGLAAGSMSLLADSIDFLGDAANFAVSLAVLGLAQRWRSRTAVLKAVCMIGFGLVVGGRAVWLAFHGGAPDAATMGAVGLLALAVNVYVAWTLYRWRSGDANMRSVWLCSRNDALGNLAVLLAAGGVALTGQAWPDLAVALLMAGLALTGGVSVLRQARGELRQAAGTGQPAAPVLHRPR